MKKPIHYLKVKHRTCSTKTGRRRSPVLGPSYEIGMPLTDESTNRIVCRKHTDGTDIIYAEIFSNEAGSPYADKSIPLADRATRLWNDLYCLNKNNGERIAFYGENALPNFLNDKQLITLSERIGQHLATTFNRQIQIGLHKKKGNYHLHFSGSEREYKNGIFLQKRQKFYKDMQGNLIYNKIYKDAHGWDIRKPIIDKTKVPAERDEYERDPVTGNYLYQQLGERNKKLWENDTRTGKFLGKKDLSDLHNDIDKIINTSLNEFGYHIKVKRNREDVLETINEAGLQQIRIPIKDFKTNSTVAEEIRKKNKIRKEYTDALTDKMEESENAKVDIIEAKKAIQKAKENEKLAIKEKQDADTTLALAEKEYQLAESEYQKALSAYNASLTKKFNFTGTELDKRKLFAKKYNSVQSGISDKNTEFMEAVSYERDKAKEIIVNAVLKKLQPNDLINISKVATQKDIASGNVAKAFLSRKKDVLEKFANRYDEKDKFSIFDWWSKSAQALYKKIHNQNTKNNQKDAQKAPQAQQIADR